MPLVTIPCNALDVSIHAPHEGERLKFVKSSIVLILFQSTLPTRGSDAANRELDAVIVVSIHAPHEGERRHLVVCIHIQIVFQSTLPTRGSDAIVDTGVAVTTMFQSTLPTRGSDQQHQLYLQPQYMFQSTLPTRGSDVFRISLIHNVCKFQSTLPTRGSDNTAAIKLANNFCFNPRSPRGGATAEKCICMQHFREFTEYYPLRHGDACCIAPQDCIIQAFFGAKKRCFYVRLCFALKNKGVRG